MLSALREEAETLSVAKQGYGPRSKDEDYSEKLHVARDAKLNSVFVMLWEIYGEVGECLRGREHGRKRSGSREGSAGRAGHAPFTTAPASSSSTDRRGLQRSSAARLSAGRGRPRRCPGRRSESSAYRCGTGAGAADADRPAGSAEEGRSEEEGARGSGGGRLGLREGSPGEVRWESPHGALSRAVRPRFPPRRSASGVRASALPARDSLAPPAGTAQQQHRVTRRAQSASLRPGRCPRAPPVTALPLASAPAVREPLSNGSGRAGRERRSAIASALGRGPRASPHRNAARAPRPPQPPPGGGSCARGSLLLFAFPPLQHNAAAR
ncbi:protein SPT2 homolog isoform X1 [Gallus gallus]|uniref:protein SPT2 homolog isoform X1 n=1 Tax=Gallus gallus TaxID=9031 RepID=UPI001AE54FB3|nr:protein SPT2 homolog isoform X1 [Gallus gallus]